MADEPEKPRTSGVGFIIGTAMAVLLIAFVLYEGGFFVGGRHADLTSNMPPVTVPPHE